MAKKVTAPTPETVAEEVVVKPAVVEEPVAKAEKPTRKIIANAPTAFRSALSMATKYIVGQMPMGTAYEIVKEVKTIHGNFYQLQNGYFITKAGDYTIY